jgi:VanZ family protein
MQPIGMTEERCIGLPVHHSPFPAVHGIVWFMIKQLLLTSSHARLRYWTAIALYVLILILGSIPGARHDIGEVASGIILHSLAYAGLTFLIFTGSKGGLPQRAGKAVLTIALMGALDEVVQSFFPYRHGAVSDWMVDCNAAVLTAGFMWFLWTRFRSQPSN